jgi:hypothetical protein
MEAGMASPRLSTLTKLRAAIEAAGMRIADDFPPGGFTLTVSGESLRRYADGGTSEPPAPSAGASAGL